ncbi:unnamed protein product [Vitrella brassicaformis CCMP3155]|uniref:Uncharacterized protein n=1 Tax=Vitrella brassicaformis (strain CCMP3155) TaxID=1169540 RepID=A0A0G4GQG1_VITBC|nr:unnamed protein product [Vitrella brassicaformis CCMP3155]|eukprot:CEM32688.1 unnamed protein product [Vitrella brassicaformis CCMP3155]
MRAAEEENAAVGKRCYPTVDPGATPLVDEVCMRTVAGRVTDAHFPRPSGFASASTLTPLAVGCRRHAASLSDAAARVQDRSADASTG